LAARIAGRIAATWLEVARERADGEVVLAVRCAETGDVSARCVGDEVFDWVISKRDR
jgi:hypothetical protein